MLRNLFLSACDHYCQQPSLTGALWEEIENSYSATSRYYHTLTHLERMFFLLEKVRGEIQDWDAVCFAVFYHDLVYDIHSMENESKSAIAARQALHQLGVPEETTARCQSHILATAKHPFSSDPDTNLFTDADLSILGQPWEDYLQYARQVRKEYAHFPDEIYFPGRKSVLQKFAGMGSLFKTDYFSGLLSNQSKENINREFDLCNNYPALLNTL